MIAIKNYLKNFIYKRNYRMRVLFLTWLAVSLVLVLLSCERDKDRLYIDSRTLLGTKVNVSIIAPNISKASQVFEDVFKEISRIESLMSPVKEGSDVKKINDTATYNPVPVSEETYNLIKKAYELSEKTNGAFDITFAAVGKLYDFKKEPFVLPENKLLWRAISLVDYRYVQFNEFDYSVFLGKKGVTIGLGGIAKGYAINKAIEVIKKNKITSAIVEAGGDIQVIGSRFGKSWKAGLTHPRQREKILLSIKLKNNDSITTSGDYERYAFIGKERYHHIIDPKKGRPTKTFSSVTVICDDPVLADAYSTAIFVMGMKKAKKFLAKHKDIKVILIDLKMNLFASKDLKKRLNLIDKEIEINWF